MLIIMYVFSLVYLMFSSEEYTIYEHQMEICITVEHDKPALFDTDVEIIVIRGSATGKLCNHHGHYWGEPYIVNLTVAGQQ